MSTMNKLLGSLAAAGFVMSIFTATAHADGIAVKTTHLKAKDRTSLKAEIAKQKRANPKAFQQLQDAPKLAQEMEDNHRGRVGSITMQLASLGDAALFPMLEMLAVDGPIRGKMSDGAWKTLKVGLIEAVGLIRDKRARPVLNTILDRETDFELERAAAEALARIGDDQSTKKLVRLALTQGPKQAPVLSALGECRRTLAAQALASLATVRDDAVALVVIKSLGTVGNAWAWQTPVIAASGERDQVRSAAAKALIKAFVSHNDYVRHKAGTALLIVADPSTPGLIQGAKKGASPELVADLDALLQRWAQSPVR
jgi:HEAT repeat protein